MPRRERLIDSRVELRRSRADVAARLSRDVGTVGRWETGEQTPHPNDWDVVGRAYGLTTPELAVALADPRPLNGHAVPGWLGVLASHEQGAGALWAFEATTVHGLLQTASYATAVERIGTTPETRARRVELRLARQAVLERQPNPLRLSVVLDESVLHRVAGGRDVMAGQLDHLADAAGWPNVDLRILPLDAGVFVFGSFALFSHTNASEPYMACVEDRAGAHYLDRDPDREAHTDLARHLAAAALDADQSAELITAVAKEYHQ